MFDKEDFDTIFSDAAVEEIDFSIWDKRIDLFVYADHMPFEGNRLPLYRVSFVAPHSFAMDYDRESMDLGMGPDEHICWWIQAGRLERAGPLWRVHLIPSMPSAPQLRVVCEDIDIVRESSSALLALFPEIKGRTSGELARPGLAKMLAEVRKKHH